MNATPTSAASALTCRGGRGARESPRNCYLARNSMRAEGRRCGGAPRPGARQFQQPFRGEWRRGHLEVRQSGCGREASARFRSRRRHAPLSSNWPPGSSVTLCPSLRAPMMNSPSIMGAQPWLRGERGRGGCRTSEHSREGEARRAGVHDTATLQADAPGDQAVQDVLHLVVVHRPSVCGAEAKLFVLCPNPARSHGRVSKHSARRDACSAPQTHAAAGRTAIAPWACTRCAATPPSPPGSEPSTARCQPKARQRRACVGESGRRRRADRRQLAARERAGPRWAERKSAWKVPPAVRLAEIARVHTHARFRNAGRANV